MNLSIPSANSRILRPCFDFIDNPLPIDVLRLICFFLDNPKDVVHFGLANRCLTVLFSDVELWNAFVHKHFPFSYAKLELRREGLSCYKRLTIIRSNIRSGIYRFQTLKGHQHHVTRLEIWGRKLISSSYDRTIKIWDLNSGKELQTLEQGGSWSNNITIVNDGKFVFSAEDYTIRIWDFNNLL
jgi:WD40 repeat protein